MSVFRRIIYHSGWFILFGPLIGAAIAIGIINFYPPLLADQTHFVVFLQNNTRISDYYRLDIQSPPRMVNWCRLRADTPEIISKIINRMILCAIAGGLITTLFNFARYGFDISILPLIYGEVLIMLIPAIVAGAIMGGVITYLPGLREVKRNNK